MLASLTTAIKRSTKSNDHDYKLVPTEVDVENSPEKKLEKKLDQLMNRCLKNLDKREAKDIAKVVIGLACAIFSGKVYYKPSKQFVDNFFQNESLHNIGMLSFVPGTMLTNMTLNFYFILELLDRFVKTSIAQQANLKTQKKPIIESLTTLVLAALPASSMALLDFMGSEEAPAWERSISLLVNLLIYGGLNLSGSESLVKSLNIFPKNSYAEWHEKLISNLKKRAARIESIMKDSSSVGNKKESSFDLVSIQIQFNNNNHQFILKQLLCAELGSDVDHTPGELFTFLTSYLFKPVAVMTLAGYFWITMVGLHKLSQEDLGLSEKNAEIFSVSLATVAVFMVYGSLMANVVASVANSLYANAMILSEKRSVSALLSYALSRQPATAVLLAIMMGLGLCSFATSVDLQIEASKAFFEWTGLDQQTGFIHQFISGFSLVFIIITAMITVLFNTFCTPLVANAAATQLNSEDANQAILNLINSFIKELNSLDPQSAIAMLTQYFDLTGQDRENNIKIILELLSENNNSHSDAIINKLCNADSVNSTGQTTSRSKASRMGWTYGLFNTKKTDFTKPLLENSGGEEHRDLGCSSNHS
jgi:hypothetical protein